MGEPTIEQLLRFCFEQADDWVELMGPSVKWPNDIDIDGDTRIIRILSNFAQCPDVPYEFRLRCFNELKERARFYREQAKPGSVPLEMVLWCFGVVSGAIEKPKRKAGHPGNKDMEGDANRNRLIVAYTAWLVGYGRTKENAIKMVGDAAGLSPKRVESIITDSDLSFDEAKAKFSPGAMEALLKTLRNPQ